jgi:hypothetical protein
LMFAHDCPCTYLVAQTAGELEPLKRRRKRQHRVERLALVELSRHVQRRAAVADRPEIDVVTARGFSP